MKKIIKITLVFLALFILISCAPKISLDKTSEDYIGNNVDDVVQELTNLGFKNIKINEIDDLNVSDNNINAIDSITIGGIIDFDLSNKFTENDEVIIEYHSIKKIEYTLSDDEINNSSIVDIKKKIIDLGFINVSGDVVYDLDPDRHDEDKIIEIIIDKDKPLHGNKYYYNSDVFIIEHRKFEKYNVNVNVNFVGNLFFSKYGLKVYMDNELISQLEHGEDLEIKLRLKKGDHIVKFENVDDIDINGEIELKNINSDTNVTYTVYCYSENVSVNETEIDRKVVINSNEVKIDFDKWTFLFKDSIGAKDFLESKGFTNISFSPDIDENESYTLTSVLINGSEEYKEKDVFNKNVKVVIVVDSKIFEEKPKESYDASERYIFSAKKETGSYTIYYLLDTKDNVAYYITTDGQDALKGSLSGGDGSFVINYGSDGKEKIEFIGGKVTLTDNDGETYDFERVSGAVAYEKCKTYIEKINNK